MILCLAPKLATQQLDREGPAGLKGDLAAWLGHGRGGAPGQLKGKSERTSEHDKTLVNSERLETTM